MFLVCNPYQRRCGLTLAACGHQDNLLRREVSGGVEGQEYVRRKTQVAEFRGHIDRLHHAPPDDADLASVSLCGVHHLLYTGDQRSECGDHHPSRCLLYSPVQGLSHHPLRGRVARHLGVSGVRKQQQDAICTVTCEGGEVKGATVHRSVVYLEVSGVYYGTQGCAYCNAHGVRDAMADTEPSGGEMLTKLVRQAGIDGRRGEFPRGTAFLELSGNETVGQSGGEYIRRDLRKDERQRPYVVLVSVGDQNTPYSVGAFHEVGNVGDDQVHAQHPLFGELHSTVDDYDVVGVFEGQHIFANFPQPSEGYDTKFLSLLCAHSYSKA